MAITSFNNSNINQIKAEIKAALMGIEDAHGIKFKMGNVTYDNKQFRFKMEVFVGSTPPQMSETTIWNDNCWRFGLTPGWLGKTFWYKGDEWKIYGLKPRSRKYPVKVIRTNDGKKMLFNVSLITKIMSEA
jgi:hypothetical protein